MLAVAGAKGGCGKTTTTLGLADAFARGGVPSLAVDADRQVPSLHLLGGVEREPTLTALAAGASVNAVSQQNPRVENSGLVAAPRDTDTVDMRQTLDGLDPASMQVLIDCPPGAGADAADAIAAADGVVVVTTDRAGALESARTTVDLARRLDVPVAGLVVNRCTAPSREARSAFDVPILATVPERASPLSDPEVQQAHDTARTQLVEGTADARQQRPRLPTGVAALDRTLGGGLFPGTVVAVSGPTDRADQLFTEAPAQRQTVYLTADRSARAVRGGFGPGADASVVELGENPLATATDQVDRLPDDVTLVVDPVDPLETAARPAYLDFLNRLATVINGTSRVALLHCRDPADTPNRATTERFADTVLEL